jgi:hypothetical protein
VSQCTAGLPEGKPRYVMGIGYPLDIVICSGGCPLGAARCRTALGSAACFGQASVSWQKGAQPLQRGGDLQEEGLLWRAALPYRHACPCPCTRLHLHAPPAVHPAAERSSAGALATAPDCARLTPRQQTTQASGRTTALAAPKRWPVGLCSRATSLHPLHASSSSLQRTTAALRIVPLVSLVC